MSAARDIFSGGRMQYYYYSTSQASKSNQHYSYKSTHKRCPYIYHKLISNPYMASYKVIIITFFKNKEVIIN